MKVYIVTHGSYDDYTIAGVFSSRQSARAFMNKDGLRRLRKKHPNADLVDFRGSSLMADDDTPFNRIEEYEVDSLSPTQWRAITTKQRYPKFEPYEGFPAEFVGPAEAFK